MQLSEVKTGEEVVIRKVRGRGAFRRRILEMGFVAGKTVRVVKNAPLKDPIEYSIMGYRLSLRRSEAEKIIVTPKHESSPSTEAGGSLKLEYDKKVMPANGNAISVAFVGNPNAGKTSLFNYISSSHEHTGNYSGVTVDSKTAHFSYKDSNYVLTDLPGTYSLSAYSPEELYVREFITDQIPDVVVNVVDASNLERNLYLTTQLIDMDIKVVLALNMYDELERRQDLLDYALLAKLLGIPVIPTVGSKGIGVDPLMDKVKQVFNDDETAYRHIHINYGSEIEHSIERIQKYLKQPENYFITDKVSSRFIAVKLLEKDKHITHYIEQAHNYDKIVETATKERKRVEELAGDDILALIAGKRYGFVSGALLETFEKNPEKQIKTADILDSFITHRLFGFPIFLFFIWLMFAATFKVGAYPQHWLEIGIGWIGDLLAQYMPPGSFKDLLIDGIIGGVGEVVVFLPNILILFLFISFMEDSGYMARAVFIMDKLMHKIGLHGKSFIPLIMGFGCNVPAIMATRTIEDKNNRLLTMLINPFMSCSARLPVYLLLIGAIFPKHQGSLLFLLYFIGILLAIGIAIVFKKAIFKAEGVPFVMELPPYRLPTLRSVLRHMWYKGSQYLKKMGGVILIASILLWALGYFPRHSHPISTNQQSKNQLHQTEIVQVASTGGTTLEQSYLGRIGKFIEPVLSPLGFDWKMGVSLLSGIAAKEIVVSTLAVLYQIDAEESEQSNSLAVKIQEDTYETGKRSGQPVFSSLATFSFLIFVLIYFPCIAVFAAVKKEAGSIWWAFFMVFYTTALAYILAFGIFQTGSLISNFI